MSLYSSPNKRDKAVGANTRTLDGSVRHSQIEDEEYQKTNKLLIDAEKKGAKASSSGFDTDTGRDIRSWARGSGAIVDRVTGGYEHRVDEDGRRLYNERKGDIEQNEAGRYIRKNRNKWGIEEEQDADHGTKWKDAGDGRLVKENKFNPHDYVDASEAYESDDKDLRSMGRDALYKKSIKDAEKEKRKISYELGDPSLKGKKIKDDDVEYMRLAAKEGDEDARKKVAAHDAIAEKETRLREIDGQLLQDKDGGIDSWENRRKEAETKRLQDMSVPDFNAEMKTRGDGLKTGVDAFQAEQSEKKQDIESRVAELQEREGALQQYALGGLTGDNIDDYYSEVAAVERERVALSIEDEKWQEESLKRKNSLNRQRESYNSIISGRTATDKQKREKAISDTALAVDNNKVELGVDAESTPELNTAMDTLRQAVLSDDSEAKANAIESVMSIRKKMSEASAWEAKESAFITKLVSRYMLPNAVKKTAEMDYSFAGSVYDTAGELFNLKRAFTGEWRSAASKIDAGKITNPELLSKLKKRYPDKSEAELTELVIDSIRSTVFDEDNQVHVTRGGAVSITPLHIMNGDKYNGLIDSTDANNYEKATAKKMGEYVRLKAAEKAYKSLLKHSPDFKEFLSEQEEKPSTDEGYVAVMQEFANNAPETHETANALSVGGLGLANMVHTARLQWNQFTGDDAEAKAMADKLDINHEKQQGYRAANAMEGGSEGNWYQTVEGGVSVAPTFIGGGVGKGVGALANLGFKALGKAGTGAAVAAATTTGSVYASGFAQSYLGVIDSYYEQLEAEVGQEKALEGIKDPKILMEAAAAGLATALTIKLMPGVDEKIVIGTMGGATLRSMVANAGGKTAFLKQLGDKKIRKDFAKMIVMSTLRGSKDEGLQESADQAMQSIAKAVINGDDRPFSEIFNEIVQAGKIGAFLGGGMSAGSSLISKGKDFDAQIEQTARDWINKSENVTPEEHAERINTALAPDGIEVSEDDIAKITELSGEYGQGVTAQAVYQEFTAAEYELDAAKASGDPAAISEAQDNLVEIAGRIEQASNADFETAARANNDFIAAEAGIDENLEDAHAQLDEAIENGTTEEVQAAQDQVDNLDIEKTTIAQARAVLKVASGTDVSALTDLELAAVGLVRSGKGVSPMSNEELAGRGLTAPAIDVSDSSSPIITDTAIANVEAHSQSGASLISETEGEARKRQVAPEPDTQSKPKPDKNEKPTTKKSVTARGLSRHAQARIAELESKRDGDPGLRGDEFEGAQPTAARNGVYLTPEESAELEALTKAGDDPQAIADVYGVEIKPPNVSSPKKNKGSDEESSTTSEELTEKIDRGIIFLARAVEDAARLEEDIKKGIENEDSRTILAKLKTKIKEKKAELAEWQRQLASNNEEKAPTPEPKEAPPTKPTPAKTQTDQAVRKIWADRYRATGFNKSADKIESGELPIPSHKQMVDWHYGNLRVAKEGMYSWDVDASDVTGKESSTTRVQDDENGWHFRISRTKSTRGTVNRISFNIGFSEELINKLDDFMHRTQAGYYKTPDNGVNWSERHDPITMYLSRNLTKTETSELLGIVEGNIRTGDNVNSLAGTKLADGVFSEDNPTDAKIDELLARAEAISPKFRSDLETGWNKVVKGKTGVFERKVSAGQFTATERTLAELEDETAPVFEKLKDREKRSSANENNKPQIGDTITVYHGGRPDADLSKEGTWFGLEHDESAVATGARTQQRIEGTTGVVHKATITITKDTVIQKGRDGTREVWHIRVGKGDSVKSEGSMPVPLIGRAKLEADNAAKAEQAPKPKPTSGTWQAFSKEGNVVEVTAENFTDAKKKLSAEIHNNYPGEQIDTDTIAQLESTGEVDHQTETHQSTKGERLSDPIPVDSDNYKKAAEKALEGKSPQVKKFAMKVLIPTLEKAGRFFENTVLGTIEGDTSGIFTDGVTLYIDIEALANDLSHLSLAGQRDAMRKLMVHEIIHKAVLSEVDPQEAIDTWNELPADLRKYVSEVYQASELNAGHEVAELGAFEGFHEYMRMLIEADERVWASLSEMDESMPNLKAKILDMLNRIINVLRASEDIGTVKFIKNRAIRRMIKFGAMDKDGNLTVYGEAQPEFEPQADPDPDPDPDPKAKKKAAAKKKVAAKKAAKKKKAKELTALQKFERNPDIKETPILTAVRQQGIDITSESKIGRKKLANGEYPNTTGETDDRPMVGDQSVIGKLALRGIYRDKARAKKKGKGYTADQWVKNFSDAGLFTNLINDVPSFWRAIHAELSAAETHVKGEQITLTTDEIAALEAVGLTVDDYADMEPQMRMNVLNGAAQDQAESAAESKTETQPDNENDKLLSAPISEKQGYVVFERSDGSRYKKYDLRKVDPSLHELDGKTVHLEGYNDSNNGGGFTVTKSQDDRAKRDETPSNDTFYSLMDYTGRSMYMSASTMNDSGKVKVISETKKPAATFGQNIDTKNDANKGLFDDQEAEGFQMQGDELKTSEGVSDTRTEQDKDNDAGQGGLFAGKRVKPDAVSRHTELEAKNEAGTITKAEIKEAADLVVEAAKVKNPNIEVGSRAGIYKDGVPVPPAPKGNNFGAGIYVAVGKAHQKLSNEFKEDNPVQLRKLKKLGLEARTEDVLLDTTNMAKVKNFGYVSMGLDVSPEEDALIKAHEQYVRAVASANQKAHNRGEPNHKIGWEKALDNMGVVGRDNAIKKGGDYWTAALDLMEQGRLPYNGILKERGGEPVKGGSRYISEAVVLSPSQIKSAEPFTGVPLDQRFNPNEDSILHAAKRIKPAQDAAYMKAVESGDVAKQQKMADAAAKAKGYWVRVTDGARWAFKAVGITPSEIETALKADEPLESESERIFHSMVADKGLTWEDGTTDIRTTSSHENIEVFKTDANLGGDSKFTRYVSIAPDGKPSSMLVLSEEGDGLPAILARYTKPEYRRKGDSSRLLDAAIKDFTTIVADWSITADGAKAYRNYQRDGKIKSADPVTYDKEGNVIPLSERFNEKSDSILYAGKRIKPNQNKHGIPMSAVDVLHNDSEVLPKPNKKVKNEVVAKTLASLAEDHWGRKITSNDITPEEIQQLVDLGEEEFIAAFEASGKDASNWYSTSIEAAMAVAAVIHPELNNDKIAKKSNGFKDAEKPGEAADLVMRIALAVTSQNLSVKLNTRFAEEQFSIFKETGRFDSSKVYGEKAESISGNMELANDMIEAGGFEALRTFVAKEFTVRELQKEVEAILGRKTSITGKVDDVLNGAAIFGPKIGQGFLQNVMGVFTPVTIDLWMRRTWGRWTGDVVGSGATPERLARLLDTAREHGMDLGELKSIRSVTRKRKSGGTFKTVSDSVATRLETDFEFAQSVLTVARGLNAIGQKHYKLSTLPVNENMLADIESGEMTNKEFIRIQERNQKWITRDFSKLTSTSKYKATRKTYNAEKNRVTAEAKAAGLDRKGVADAVNNIELEKPASKAEFSKQWYQDNGYNTKHPKPADLKSGWSKSSAVIVNALKPLDIPSPQDRIVISKVINSIRKSLLAKGYETTNADVQAVLWYPEKDLWAKLRGEEESNLKSSYDEQFLEIAKSKGLGKRAIQAAESIYSSGSGTTRSGGTNDSGSKERTGKKVAKPKASKVGKNLHAGKRIKPEPSFVEPGFYSQLYSVVEDKMGNTAQPAQIMGMLNPSKGSGVKAEEIKWSGIEAALPALTKNGKVSKDELLEYLETEGRLQFKEVTQSNEIIEAPYQWEQDRQEVLLRRMAEDEAEETGENEEDIYDRIIRDASILSETMSEARSEWEEGRQNHGLGGETQYAQYQLPGGENYREVVLAMPLKGETGWGIVDDGNVVARFNTEKEALEAYGDYGYGAVEEVESRMAITATKNENGAWEIYQEGNHLGTTYDGETEQDAINDFRSSSAVADNHGEYTSSHFSGVPNYVAHMRLNERDGGLFIEEIQSDRHQEGRKNGYNEDRPERKTVESLTREELLEVIKLNENGNDTLEGDEDIDSLRETVNFYLEEDPDTIKFLTGNDVKKGTPDAPYRKEWPMAMFKRALRDAVENGKTWIGWTSGETQNGRYDLSKQVDLVYFTAWPAKGEGAGILTAHKNGQQVIKKDTNESELESLLGKDVAKRLLESDEHKPTGQRMLSGDDLKVGGNGMKGFYDGMLPKSVQKYVKKWGGKVERSHLSDGQIMPETAEGFEIDGVWITDPTLDETGMPFAQGIDPVQYWMDQGATKEDIESTSGNKYEDIKTDAIWRVNITPEMAESVKGGQMLFAAKRIKPAQDAAYMKAVESGDMDTAQAMVDARAKEAGYDEKVYHGTLSKFNKFNPLAKTASFLGRGSWFTSSKQQAEKYASVDPSINLDIVGKTENLAKDLDIPYLKAKALISKSSDPNVFGGYVNTDGFLSVNADTVVSVPSLSKFKGYIAEHDGNQSNQNIDKVYKRFEDAKSHAEQVEILRNLQASQAFTSMVRDSGYSGIVFEAGVAPLSKDATHTVAFSPNQIKSADPVTYDKEGEVIPPSQRFNEKSDSTLYAGKRIKASDILKQKMPETFQDRLTQAEGEKEGEFTVGDPNKALGAATDTTRAVHQSRKDERDAYGSPYGEQAIEDAAIEMLKTDFDGVVQKGIEAGAAGTVLDPVMTAAVKHAVLRLTKQVATSNDPELREQAQLLTLAHDISGSEWSAIGRARKDRWKTRADRNRAFLMGEIMGEDKEATEKWMKGKESKQLLKQIKNLENAIENLKDETQIAKAAAKKAQLEMEHFKKKNAVSDPYRKSVEAAMEKMGITMEDVFAEKVSLKLRASKMDAAATRDMKQVNKEAIRMMKEGKSPSEIKKDLNLTKKQFNDVITDYKVRLREEVAKWSDKAIKKGGSAKNILAAAKRIRPEGDTAMMSDVEREAYNEAMVRAIMDKMGIADSEADYNDRMKKQKQEQTKQRKKKDRKVGVKIEPTPEQLAKWEKDFEAFQKKPMTKKEYFTQQLGLLGVGVEATPEQLAQWEKDFTEFKDKPLSKKDYIENQLDLLADDTKPTPEQLAKWAKDFDEFTKQDTIKKKDYLELQLKLSMEVEGGSFDPSNDAHVASLYHHIGFSKNSRVVDYFKEAFISNVLAAPSTAITNLTGMAYAGFRMTAGMPMEMLYNSIREKVMGELNEDAPTFGEWKYMYQHMGSRIAQAAKLAMIAWDVEQTPFFAHYLDEPMGKPHDPLHSGDDKYRQHIKGTKGRVLRASIRGLVFVDTFFRSVTTQMLAGGMAHRLALKNGLKPGSKEFNEFIGSELATSGSVSWQNAAHLASKWTFTLGLRDMKNSGGLVEGATKGISKAINSGHRSVFAQLAEGIGTTFLPFVATPYRLYAAGLSMSPAALPALLYTKDNPTLDKDKNPLMVTSKEAQQSIKNVNATLATTALMMLFSFVRGGDDDDEEWDFEITGAVNWKDRGKHQHSKRKGQLEAYTIKVGSHKFSYQRLDPFATSLAIMVDAITSIKRMKAGEEAGQEMTRILHSQYELFSDKAFLQGIANLMRMHDDIFNKKDKASTTLTNHFVKTISSTFLPNYIRRTANYVDPMRDIKSEPLSARTIAYKLVPQPWYAPEKRVDLYGNEIHRGGDTSGMSTLGKIGNALSYNLTPGNPKQIQESEPADDWIRRFNLQTKDEDDKWYPEEPFNRKDSISYTNAAGEKIKRKMTGEEWKEFNGIRAKILNTNLKIIKPIFNRKKILPMDQPRVKKAYDDSVKKARNAVRSKAKLKKIASK